MTRGAPLRPQFHLSGAELEQATPRHRAPAIGAVHGARPPAEPLDFADLVEHKPRMIAGAAEMAVVGACLPARHRSGSRWKSMSSTVIFSGRRWSLSIHSPGRSASAARFSGRLSYFVSKRPVWLAEAAESVIARSPSTQRIAGSRHSLSASFYVLAAGQPPEHDWRNKPANRWRRFFPGARLGGSAGTLVGQFKGVVQLAMS